MRLQRVSAALACALALSISACGDKDPTTTSNPQAVAGTYVATQFLTTTGGSTTNQLAAGGSVTLVLGADGKVSGRLFIPGLADAPLSGTWTVNNNSDVAFTGGSDTFLRDMLLKVNGNTLVGDQTFSGVRIQLVLTKQ